MKIMKSLFQTLLQKVRHLYLLYTTPHSHIQMLCVLGLTLVPYEYTTILNCDVIAESLPIDYNILLAVKDTYLTNDYLYYFNHEFEWLNTQIEFFQYQWLTYYSMNFSDYNLNELLVDLWTLVKRIFANVISVINSVISLNEKYIWEIWGIFSNVYKNNTMFYWYYNSIYLLDQYQYNVISTADIYYPSILELLGQSNNWDILYVELFIKNKHIFDYNWYFETSELLVSERELYIAETPEHDFYNYVSEMPRLYHESRHRDDLTIKQTLLKTRWFTVGHPHDYEFWMDFNQTKPIAAGFKANDMVVADRILDLQDQSLTQYFGNIFNNYGFYTKANANYYKNIIPASGLKMARSLYLFRNAEEHEVVSRGFGLLNLGLDFYLKKTIINKTHLLTDPHVPTTLAQMPLADKIKYYPNAIVLKQIREVDANIVKQSNVSYDLTADNILKSVPDFFYGKQFWYLDYIEHYNTFFKGVRLLALSKQAGQLGAYYDSNLGGYTYRHFFNIDKPFVGIKEYEDLKELPWGKAQNLFWKYVWWESYRKPLARKGRRRSLRRNVKKILYAYKYYMIDRYTQRLSQNMFYRFINAESLFTKVEVHAIADSARPPEVLDYKKIWMEMPGMKRKKVKKVRQRSEKEIAAQAEFDAILKEECPWKDLPYDSSIILMDPNLKMFQESLRLGGSSYESFLEGIAKQTNVRAPNIMRILLKKLTPQWNLYGRHSGPYKLWLLLMKARSVKSIDALLEDMNNPRPNFPKKVLDRNWSFISKRKLLIIEFHDYASEYDEPRTYFTKARKIRSQLTGAYRGKYKTRRIFRRRSSVNVLRFYAMYYDQPSLILKRTQNLYFKFFKQISMAVTGHADIMQRSQLALQGQYQATYMQSVYSKTYSLYIDKILQLQQINTELKAISTVADLKQSFILSSTETTTFNKYSLTEDPLKLADATNNFTRNNTEALIWKKEYFISALKLFHEDANFYKNFFFWKNSTHVYEHLKITILEIKSMVDEVYLELNWTIKVSKKLSNIVETLQKTYINSKLYIILVVGAALYIIVAIWFSTFLKIQLPKNLIYGVKMKNVIDEKKNEIAENKWFTAEDNYIYTWNNKKSPKEYSWIEKTQKSSVLNENYMILYKQFTFDKNLEKLANVPKIKASIFVWLHFFIFFRNNSRWIMLLKMLTLYFRDTWFNYPWNIEKTWKIEETKSPTADSLSTGGTEYKAPYIYYLSRYFHKFFFVIKFVWSLFQFWQLTAKRTWQSTTLFGTKIKFNYYGEVTRLLKDSGIVWVAENSDWMEAHTYDDPFVLNEMLKDATKIPEQSEEDLCNMLNLEYVPVVERNTVYPESFFSEKTAPNERFKASIIPEPRLNMTSTLTSVDTEAMILMERELKHKYRFHIYDIKLDEAEVDLIKRQKIYNITGRMTMSNTYFDIECELRDMRSTYDDRVLDIKNDLYLRSDKTQIEYVNKYINSKDEPFFQKVPEYKAEYAAAVLAYREAANMEVKKRMQKKEWYQLSDEKYIAYKFFSSVGKRYAYFISLLKGLFATWLINIQHVKRNELTVRNIFNVSWSDRKKYIFQMYFEYIILMKNLESFKKFGYKVLSFFVIIFVPLLFYIYCLHLLLCVIKLFFFVFTFFRKNVSLTLTIKNIRSEIIRDVCVYIQILKLLLWDVQTSEFFFVRAYQKFYVICGIFQKNYIFIKKILKVHGVTKVIEVYRLKLIIFLEKKPKIHKKSKSDFNLHFELIYFFMKEARYWKDARTQFFVGFLEVMFVISERYLYVATVWSAPLVARALWNYFDVIKWNIFYIKKYWKNLTIKVIFSITLHILLHPWERFKDAQIAKFVKNYESGLLAFWQNPMYQVVDYPHLDSGKFRLKIYNFFRNLTISNWLHFRKTTVNGRLEFFLLKQTLEYAPNMFLKLARENNYASYLVVKDKIYRFIYKLVFAIEYDFGTYDNHLGGHQWTLWKRFRMYFKKLNMAHVNSKLRYQHMLRDARNILFYKKVQDRTKILRRYFIIAIINFISYILTKKVIFSTDKFLKPQTVKLTKYGIKLHIFEETLGYHIGLYLNTTPPELWLLVLLYEQFYKGYFRYIYVCSEPELITDRLVLHPDFKWRISANMGKLEHYAQGLLSNIASASVGYDLAQNMEKGPIDLNMIFALFILENLMGVEALDKIWKKRIWADVSLTQAVTYKVTDPSVWDAELADMPWFASKLRKNIFKSTLTPDTMLEYETRDFSFKYKSEVLQDKEAALHYIKTEKKEHLDRAFLFYEAVLNNSTLSDSTYESPWDAVIARVYDESMAVYNPEYETNVAHPTWPWSFGRFDWDDLKKTCQRTGFDINDFVLLIETAAFNNTQDDILFFLKKRMDFIKKPYINHVNLHIIPEVNSTLQGAKYTHKRGLENTIYYLHPVIFYEDYMTNLVEIDYFQNEDALKANYVLITLEDTGVILDYWVELLELTLVNKPMLVIRSYANIMFNCYGFLKRNRYHFMTPALFINNVKWSWAQWLGLAPISAESAKLRYRNTLIFNERYRLFFLKKVPLRVKVPVFLEIPYVAARDMLKSQFNWTNLDTRYFFPGAAFNGVSRRSVNWQKLKRQLEEEYKMPTLELVLRLTDTSMEDVDDGVPLTPEMQAIDEFKKKNVVGISKFLKRFFSFFKLDFAATVDYSWDLLTFHNDWKEYMEDFDTTLYFSVKLQQFVRSDPTAAKWMDVYAVAAWYKYSPTRYIRFFSEPDYLYGFYFCIQYISWTVAFYILMYEHGSFMYDPVWLLLSITVGWYCSISKNSITEHKVWLRGKTLYLYKYQIFDEMPVPRKQLFTLFKEQDELEEIEHSQLDYRVGYRWTETHRFLYYRYRYYTWRFSSGMFSFFWFYWIILLYENNWHLYRDFGFFYFKGQVVRANRDFPGFHGDYSKIVWYEDCYRRVQCGGNPFNVWYINRYRTLQDKSLLELDPKETIHLLPRYTFHWTKMTYVTTPGGEPISRPMNVNVCGGVADMELVYWSNVIVANFMNESYSATQDRRWLWYTSDPGVRRGSFYRWFFYVDKRRVWPKVLDEIRTVWADFIVNSRVNAILLMKKDDERLSSSFNKVVSLYTSDPQDDPIFNYFFVKFKLLRLNRYLAANPDFVKNAKLVTESERLLEILRWKRLELELVLQSRDFFSTIWVTLKELFNQISVLEYLLFKRYPYIAVEWAEFFNFLINFIKSFF